MNILNEKEAEKFRLYWKRRIEKQKQQQKRGDYEKEEAWW